CTCCWPRSTSAPASRTSRPPSTTTPKRCPSAGKACGQEEGKRGTLLGCPFPIRYNPSERRVHDAADHDLHQRRLRPLPSGDRVSVAQGRAVHGAQRGQGSDGSARADGARAHLAAGDPDRRQAAHGLQSHGDRRRAGGIGEGHMPSQANIDKMWAYARKFAEKSGTSLHPDVTVTETVVEGLARHIEEVGRPLCPCNFYPDPKEEAKQRRWICACEEMQKYKYCHCLR